MNTVDVAWSRIEVSHMCANVVQNKGERKEEFRSIGTVSRKLVSVLVKKNQSSVDKLNHFLKAAIFGEFFYIRNVEWKSIRHHN